MDKVPDEVLEFILGFLPPYGDLQRCLLVSKRWSICAQNVISKTRINLYRAITNFNIVWESMVPVDMANTIAKRYSHSAIVHKNSMYVFGGCTCTSTTFNDIWKLDLSTKQFNRLLTMGSYPSPKACASIVCYNDTLVLFGGWTHPSPYPLHQSWRLFNELHLYNITQNRWVKHVHEDDFHITPPAMAGHSVSLHKSLMVVFGGLQKSYSGYNSQFSSSNDLWCFDLDTLAWHKPYTNLDKPMPRYGQSQIYLDNENFLIIGGCKGSNQIYSDCWLMTIDFDDRWKWRKVNILNKDAGPGNMWCNQACKVGDKLVVLSQAKMTSAPLNLSSKWNLPNQIRRTSNPPDRRNEGANLNENEGPQRLIKDLKEKLCSDVDKDENINGKWGHFTRRSKSSQETNKSPSEPIAGSSKSDNSPTSSRLDIHSQPGTSSEKTISNQIAKSPNINMAPSANSQGGNGMLAFKDKTSSTAAQSERLRRLDVVTQRLRQYEESFQRAELRKEAIAKAAKNEEKESTPSPKKHKRNQLAIFVLDISKVLSEECCATWLTNECCIIPSSAPEETILYSFVAGNGELIMFGGIKRDADSLKTYSKVTEQVSNTVYFLRAPKSII